MQDLGKERVEERVTGVEDEVEAMKEEFSLRLKTKDRYRKRLKSCHFGLKN